MCDPFKTSGHPPARAPGVRGTSRHVARSLAIPARRPPRQVEPVRVRPTDPTPSGLTPWPPAAFSLAGLETWLAVHEEPALPSGV